MRVCSGPFATISRIRGLARFLVLGSIVAFAPACSGGDEADEVKQRTGVGNEPGCEGRGETISLGMSKTSADGVLQVVLSDAAPIPPVQGENSWTVEVSKAGQPVLDVDDTDAQVIANVYMAEHDHNVRTRGTMTAPGVFDFLGFPLTMNGYWEITIQVVSDQDSDDVEDAVFGFCVQN